MSNTGILVSSNGVPRTFKGTLLAFLGDNLASNGIGGFKKSFSFSFRCCRTCLATKTTLSSSYVSDSFKLRDDSSHQTQLSMLNGPASENYSVHQSTFMFVDFSLFNSGLPHDAMHDILEGIAPQHIKRLYTSNGYFSFNRKLVNFNYGYTESDRPVPILSSTLQASSIFSIRDLSPSCPTFDNC